MNPARDDWKTRRPRNVPGQAHELTFSTFQKRPVLLLPGAAQTFLNCLDQARRHEDFLVYAYVVMPTHCHILLRSRRVAYSISDILSAIKTPAAKAIFELHPSLRETMQVQRPSRGIEYRFWQQGGGFDRNVQDETALANMMNYIHLNPVRAGLCEFHRDWPWSSFRATLGEPTPIPVDPMVPD